VESIYYIEGKGVYCLYFYQCVCYSRWTDFFVCGCICWLCHNYSPHQFFILFWSFFFSCSFFGIFFLLVVSIFLESGVQKKSTQSKNTGIASGLEKKAETTPDIMAKLEKMSLISRFFTKIIFLVIKICHFFKNLVKCLLWSMIFYRIFPWLEYWYLNNCVI